MKNVLLAYDGSEGAKRALEAVAELHHEGGTVTVVSSAEGLPLFGYAGTLPSPEQEEERHHQLVEAETALAEHGIATTLVERRGDPATAILDEAEKAHADLIVMGTRGLSTGERWLLGSVSTKVLHHAHCSVLVVR
ncbi:MAG TPA: universal stress protein [Gaiellaceae bacterium]|nr:universal stress protein [Gaiellaceae bacterium]